MIKCFNAIAFVSECMKTKKYNLQGSEFLPNGLCNCGLLMYGLVFPVGRTEYIY